VKHDSLILMNRSISDDNEFDKNRLIACYPVNLL
jgi:hypothetical protein